MDLAAGMIIYPASEECCLEVIMRQRSAVPGSIKRLSGCGFKNGMGCADFV